MDPNRLTDYTSLIKHHLASLEVLLEYHAKVEAMVEVILSKDLTDISNEKLHNYLWVVSDLIVKAKELNEKLLDTLEKMVPLLSVSEIAMLNML